VFASMFTMVFPKTKLPSRTWSSTFQAIKEASTKSKHVISLYTTESQCRGVVKEKEAGMALPRRSNQDPCPKNAQARKIHLLRINVSLDKTTIVWRGLWYSCGIVLGSCCAIAVSLIANLRHLETNVLTDLLKRLKKEHTSILTARHDHDAR
jgi:hypothetical protein